MAHIVLDRRAVLQSLGGLAIGLPALEALGPRTAYAGSKAQRPKRFVISYAGCSTGAYKDQDQLVPDIVGLRYDVKRALAPLKTMGLRDHVSVVTGLLSPWQEKKDSAMPPGGRTTNFHFNTVGPQVAGTHTGPGPRGTPKGPSADQIVADAIAGSTAHRVLAYRVQPVSYVGGNKIDGDSGRLSWARTPDGQLTPVDPIVSPTLAYESLLGSFVPSGKKGAGVRTLLKERRSVLDFVTSETQRLLARLGANDRSRVERHFEELRSLEKRLEPTSVETGSRHCRVLPPPGPDPEVGGALKQSSGYSVNAGYSGEEERADILVDLIGIAMACDLSRVASFMITEWKCYMNMVKLSGWKSDMHELSHFAAGPKVEAVSDSVAWCVKQWAKLIRRLKDLPEPDGSNVLDHTAMVLLFEGGHGFDPEGNRKRSPHSAVTNRIHSGTRYSCCDLASAWATMIPSASYRTWICGGSRFLRSSDRVRRSIATSPGKTPRPAGPIAEMPGSGPAPRRQRSR
jgi:hypothetical protein